MAQQVRRFGTQLNVQRNAPVPVNKPNGPSLKPIYVPAYPVHNLENQENIPYIDNHAFNKGHNLKPTSKVCDTNQNVFNKQKDEKILDENIEAVKNELSSFLIDSFDKSSSTCQENVESKHDESLMIVEHEASLRESSQDDSMEQSDATYIQNCPKFDRLFEYSNEIAHYLYSRERKFMPDPFYMNKQTSINNKMRCILIDWMVDVADEYKLKDETLFLAINYIDRMLSKMVISRQEFQLLGTTSLFIAAKYEEVYPPEIREFVYITDDSFTNEQILKMEKVILEELDFNISPPTANYFLEKMTTEMNVSKEIYCYSKYLCFLTTLECIPFLKYYPSEIAISCIMISYKVLTGNIPESLSSCDYERSLESKGNVSQLLSDRTDLIDSVIQLRSVAPTLAQKAVQRKFSSSKYCSVSTMSVD